MGNPNTSFFDVHTQLVKSGKVVAGGNFNDMIGKRVIELKMKETLFDGYFFELHIPIDKNVTIQHRLLIRVKTTLEHPDLVTPIILPEVWDITSQCLFNNFYIPEDFYYIYKIRDAKKRVWFVCDYIDKDGKKYQRRGSIERISNLVYNHRTRPIDMKYVRKIQEVGYEVWSVDLKGKVTSHITKRKKKEVKKDAN